jgi:hypothetical protein
MPLPDPPIRFCGWELHDGIWIKVVRGINREVCWQELAERERTAQGKPQWRVLPVWADPNDKPENQAL